MHLEVRPTEVNLARLDGVIDALRRTRTAYTPSGEARPIDAFAVQNDAGDLLERAAQASGPGPVIEVGCGSALSTLHLARGRARVGCLGTRSVQAIDPWQDGWGRIGVHAIERAGLGDEVIVHEKPAHEVLPVLLAAGQRASLVFIDGCHHLDFVMLEAFYADLMLDEGGMIALHDLWMPSLQHVASYWTANRAYEPVTLRQSPGGAWRFEARPCTSERRQIGDPASALPAVRDRLGSFVDRSVLFLRKTGPDRRAWNEFHPYAA